MHPAADDERPEWLTQQRLDVGRRIRDARRWANLSQEALAERIGVERRTVVRTELGITSPPLDRILWIAHALGVSPSSLLPDE
ncbi:helix-turn-helix domain-containing protein [Streptomyces sp. B15]|uniref:helix-turn-helix domain-containing protein n=1 Tax=Streptomyces sp. B15 TaxID=1537797 RepID=UPI001B380691|nr:helix-turn-helix transcriptional regulator [Streptomyces sp. B15]MBQ1122666.1 helix-turn-helix transcriptional regulator [Streptomyces sp. B15]